MFKNLHLDGDMLPLALSAAFSTASVQFGLVTADGHLTWIEATATALQFLTVFFSTMVKRKPSDPEPPKV